MSSKDLRKIANKVSEIKGYEFDPNFESENDIDDIMEKSYRIYERVKRSKSKDKDVLAFKKELGKVMNGAANLKKIYDKVTG